MKTTDPQQLGPEDGEDNFDDTAVQMGWGTTSYNVYFISAEHRALSPSPGYQPNGSQVYGM
jgi:hypothetical protein